VAQRYQQHHLDSLSRLLWTLLLIFRHTGFTTEGLEVSYEPDYGEVEVDQLLDSAKLFKAVYEGDG